ncbi:MAG: hypothetical protein RJA67_885, partial [Bacteroidota bacterium]
MKKDLTSITSEPSMRNKKSLSDREAFSFISNKLINLRERSNLLH